MSRQTSITSDEEAAEALTGLLDSVHDSLIDEDAEVAHALEAYLSEQASEPDTLDRVADQLEIQNAVLFEAVRALQRQNRIAMGRDPDDTPSPTALATMVEDGALHLAEGVDLEAAQRWADE